MLPNHIDLAGVADKHKFNERRPKKVYAWEERIILPHKRK